MIASINLYPINIPIGTVINSGSSLMFYDYQLDAHISRMHADYDEVACMDKCHYDWSVGYILEINRPIYKLQVVESIGDIIIHRYYITDDLLRDKGLYIPINMTIYGNEQTQMLSYRSGITEIWKRYKPTNHEVSLEPEFVNNRIANTILCNQFGIPYVDHHMKSWEAYRSQYCPYISDIDNNYPFTAEAEYDPYSDYIWQHNSEIYDYNSDVYNEQYDFIGNISDYLAGYQGVNSNDDTLVTCDILDYTIPTQYRPVAIDTVTRRDLSNSLVHISQITSGSRRMNTNYVPPITFNSANVNVFNYDSSILELCTILAHSDYIEVSCTYTLSSGELYIANCISVNKEVLAGNHSSLANMLSLTLSRWGYPEIVAYITKTYHNVLNLSITACHADNTIESQTYVIDLALIPAINHNLAT